MREIRDPGGIWAGGGFLPRPSAGAVTLSEVRLPYLGYSNQSWGYLFVVSSPINSVFHEGRDCLFYSQGETHTRLIPLKISS